MRVPDLNWVPDMFVDDVRAAGDHGHPAGTAASEDAADCLLPEMASDWPCRASAAKVSERRLAKAA